MLFVKYNVVICNGGALSFPVEVVVFFQKKWGLFWKNCGVSTRNRRVLDQLELKPIIN